MCTIIILYRFYNSSGYHEVEYYSQACVLYIAEN